MEDPSLQGFDTYRDSYRSSEPHRGIYRSSDRHRNNYRSHKWYLSPVFIDIYRICGASVHYVIDFYRIPMPWWLLPTVTCHHKYRSPTKTQSTHRWGECESKFNETFNIARHAHSKQNTWAWRNTTRPKHRSTTISGSRKPKTKKTRKNLLRSQVPMHCFAEIAFISWSLTASTFMHIKILSALREGRSWFGNWSILEFGLINSKRTWYFTLLGKTNNGGWFAARAANDNNDRPQVTSLWCCP